MFEIFSLLLISFEIIYSFCVEKPKCLYLQILTFFYDKKNVDKGLINSIKCNLIENRKIFSSSSNRDVFDIFSFLLLCEEKENCL